MKIWNDWKLRLVEILSEQRASTKENVERKQARTDGEREEEEEEVVEHIEEDDDDEDVPYNPKNLPLGWDGKVIYIMLNYNGTTC